MPGSNNRRGFLSVTAALAAGLSNIAPARAATDDPAWIAKFKALIEQTNRFIDSLNGGIFDERQWKRVRGAWRDLDRHSGAG